MERLGFERPKKVQEKINRILKNKEHFLAIKELSKGSYTIVNRISRKYITEYTYNKDDIEEIFKELI
jgi:hypothetical protein